MKNKDLEVEHFDSSILKGDHDLFPRIDIPKFKSKEDHLNDTPLGGNYLMMTECQITNANTLLVFTRGYEYRVLLIINSDITGCNTVLESDKPAIIFYFNNITEKWWRRFGVTIHIPVKTYLKSLKKRIGLGSV